MEIAPRAPRSLEEALNLLQAVYAEVVALRVENAELRAENGQWHARVQELEARLGQNSTNSSRPPSTDPPAAPPPRSAAPRGRRRGGQPGHRPHQRTLLPADAVDQVVEHWPAACGHCQAPLLWKRAVGEPARHQVTDLPVVQATVTEHRLHQVACPACRRTTRARLPGTVPRGAFGPRLQATVAVLSGRYRLSRREVAAVCADVLGVARAVGSVDGLCQATAQVLTEPVAELRAAVRQAPVVHADETGWREAGQRRWLWTAVAPLVSVFVLAASRGSQVIEDLLGDGFAGYLVSDRWSAYTWHGLAKRQVCWAHLKRDFQGLVDYGGEGRAVGTAALRLEARLFAAWARWRADPTQCPRFVRQVRRLKRELRQVLEAGRACRGDTAAGLCRALLKVWPALWTFVTVPGVAPTNNAAEQALRPAVLWRKGSFGTQSAAGNHFVECMLSVAATCRLQQRSALAYVTAACLAAQQGLPLPTLLPSPPTTPSVPLPAQAA